MLAGSAWSNLGSVRMLARHRLPLSTWFNHAKAPEVASLACVRSLGSPRAQTLACGCS